MSLGIEKERHLRLVQEAILQKCSRGSNSVTRLGAGQMAFTGFSWIPVRVRTARSETLENTWFQPALDNGL